MSVLDHAVRQEEFLDQNVVILLLLWCLYRELDRLSLVNQQTLSITTMVLGRPRW